MLDPLSLTIGATLGAALAWHFASRKSTDRAREAYARGRASAWEEMARTNGGRTPSDGERRQSREEAGEAEVVDLAGWAEANGRRGGAA